jgi:hypothetical protein
MHSSTCFSQMTAMMNKLLTILVKFNIGAFIFFTDSITEKCIEDLVLLSDWGMGRIFLSVLLGYTLGDCDGR